MAEAGKDVHNIIKPNYESEIVDCTAQLDGTWMTRGYASLNGVVAAVAQVNKKVIDTYVLSKFCKACAVWERRKDTPSYLEFEANHQCPINHKGSAGAMEAAGAVEIFASSVQKHNLRYSKYLGDRDTGSFNKVVESKPYGDEIVPVKLECVGHVQKCLGNRLRAKRKALKGKTLSVCMYVCRFTSFITTII